MRGTLAVAPVLALCAVAMLGARTDASGETPDKISIFVGPQTREGFADVDSGVLDSIKDVREAIRRSGQFTLARTRDEAKIVLMILGRRRPGDSGSVGIPAGALTIMVPIKRRAIDSILRVGSYEKRITSESDDDDRWKAAAKRVVKDVTAWVEANRSALSGGQSVR